MNSKKISKKEPKETFPGTEYAAGSKEDLAYARGYEDAEEDMRNSKGKDDDIARIFADNNLGPVPAWFVLRESVPSAN